jgi:DNA-binding response OmpR family regulator
MPWVPIATDGPRSQAPPDEPRQLRQIVVVEDDDDSRGAIVMVLALEGYEVREAASAEEGLSEILKPETALALIDIGLPGEDGFSLLSAVRSAIGDLMPMIALTGRAEVAEHARIMAAGFRKHLTKPVSPDGLRIAVGAVLDGPDENRTTDSPTTGAETPARERQSAPENQLIGR